MKQKPKPVKRSYIDHIDMNNYKNMLRLPFLFDIYTISYIHCSPIYKFVLFVLLCHIVFDRDMHRHKLEI